MQSINLSFWRNPTFCDQPGSEYFHLRINYEFLYTSQCIKTSLSRFWMALRCFPYHKFRSKQLVFGPRLFPPLHCYLLPRRNSYVTAGPCCQITWNGCFYVYTFHIYYDSL